MIKLKDILKELDYGNELFGSTPKSLRMYSSRMLSKFQKDYDISSEENTKEEDNILKNLYDYLKLNKKDIQHELDDIFQLKSKFPKMLDPHYELKFKYAYRGMSMPIPDVVDILERNPFKESNLIKIHNNPIIKIEDSGLVQPRSSKGFSSLSSELKKAWEFASDMQNKHVLQGRYPVVIRIPYNKIANRSLFNPSFLDVFTNYKEHEFWVLGDSLPYDAVYLPIFSYTGDKEHGIFIRDYISDYRSGNQPRSKFNQKAFDGQADEFKKKSNSIPFQ